MKILCIKVFTSSGSQDHVIYLTEVKPNKKKRKDDISIELLQRKKLDIRWVEKKKKLNKQRP